MSSFVCPATELKLECDMTLFEQRLTFPTTFGDRFRIWSVTNNIQSMGVELWTTTSLQSQGKLKTRKPVCPIRDSNQNLLSKVRSMSSSGLLEAADHDGIFTMSNYTPDEYFVANTTKWP